MSRINFNQGYFVLLGGFLLHLSTGNVYICNFISPELIKFMNESSYDRGNIDSSNFIWVFSMSIFGLGSAVTIGGILSTKIGPSLTVLLGGWFMSLNILMMSLAIRSYLWIVVMSYGLFTGIGSGIVYGVSMGTACQWFPNHKGLACGIVVSGFGLSSFISDTVQFFIMKQEKQSEILPLTYIIVGSIYFAIQFIGSLMLFPPPGAEPEEKRQSRLENSTKLLDFANSRSTHHSLDVEIAPHQLYLELDYWILWITLALLSACYTLAMSMTPDLGNRLHVTNDPPYYLVIASSIGLLCNSFGRIVWGYLIDKIKYKNTMLAMTLSLSISFATLYAVIYFFEFNQQPNKPGVVACFIIWIVLLYFIPSGIYSIFPQICSKLFGCAFFVANYGMLFTAYSFGGLLTGTIYTLSSHNFLAICISGSLMSLLAASVTILYRGRSLVHREAICS